MDSLDHLEGRGIVIGTPKEWVEDTTNQNLMEEILNNLDNICGRGRDYAANQTDSDGPEDGR